MPKARFEVVRDRLLVGLKWNPFLYEANYDHLWLKQVQTYCRLGGLSVGSYLFLAKDRETGVTCLACWLTLEGREFAMVDEVPWPALQGRMPLPTWLYVETLFRPAEEHAQHASKELKERQYERVQGEYESACQKLELATHHRKKGDEQTARMIESGFLPVASEREAATDMDEALLG